MTALRFFFTAIPVIFFVKKPNITISVLALYGIIFGGGLWGVVNYAISLGTPSGLSSLILQASAFMSIIAGVVFFQENIVKSKKIGIILAFIGFLVIIYANYDLSENTSIYGIFLVLFAALSWTICNMIIKKYKPDNVVGFTAWSSLFVPLPILLLAYIDTGDNFVLLFTNIGMQGYYSVFFQAFVTTLLGYSLWAYTINKYGLSLVAPYSLIVPISGILFAWILYGEVLNFIEALGVFIVFIGLVLNMGIFKRNISH